MALLLPAAGGILFLTLSPQGAGSDAGLHPLCLVCGHAYLANILRNVLLFMPMGLVLGRWLGRSGPVLLLAILLSAGIETAQWFIPGRNAILMDVLANGAGGWLGGLMGARLDLFLHPEDRSRTLLRWSAGVVATGLIAFSAWALSLSPPNAALTLNIAPVGPPDSRPETSRGRVPDTRVHRAELDGESMVRGPYDESELLARRIVGLFTGRNGAPRLELRFSPGVAPFEQEQTLFRVHSGIDGREAMAVSLARDELRLSPPLRASAVSLVGPSLRWPGALEHAAPADTLHLVVSSPGNRQYCLELEGTRRCEVLPSIAEGWSLLLFPRVPAWGRGLLTFLWIAMLFAPIGFWSRSVRETLPAVLLPSMVLLLLPMFLAYLRLASPVAWAAVFAGVAAGMVLPRPPVREPVGKGPHPTLLRNVVRIRRP